MRIRSCGTLGLVFFLFSAAGYGQIAGLGENNRFELEVRRWRPNFRSELEVGGSFIDAKNDLGVEDEREFEYRGFLRFGRWVKIRGSGVRFDFQGASTLEKEIAFGGVTFPEGTTVETNMKLEFYKGGAEVDILALREGFLAVVAEYSSFKIRPVALTSAEERAEETLDVALLTLGLKGRLYLTPGLALTAEASGMKKSDSGVITDYEGVITYNLSRNIGVSFGYRNLYVKWLEEGRATFRLKGYFFSGSIRF